VATIAESTRVFSLLSLIVVILGFGVMGLSDPSDHFPFTTSWILTSVIVYIVALLLSLFQFGVPCVERPRNSSLVIGAGGQCRGGASRPRSGRHGYCGTGFV
jgi:hypothetical protein